MAEEVKIIFEIEGIQQTVSSVEELQAALKGIDKQAQKTEKSVEGVADAAKDMGKKAEEGGKAGEGALKVMDEATGGLATKVKEVGQGLVKMGKTGYQALLKLASGSKAFALAIASTGIGLLVVALGVIASQWDNILGTVTGVGGEQKKLLEDANETAAAQQESLSSLEASENSLKLQGKSEREIRDLKIEQTQEAIAALTVALEQQKQVKKAQVEASTRNRDILSGMLQFVSLPITALLKAYDYIMGTDYANSIFDSVSEMIFDPEEVAADGDATIAETEKTLASLRNKKDGFILANKEAEATDRKDKIAADKAAADEIADYEAKKAQELADLKKAIRDAEANTEAEQRAKALEDLDNYYLALIDKATQNGLDTTELETSRLESMKALKQKNIDEDNKITTDNQAIVDGILQQANLDSMEQMFERAQAELQIQYDLNRAKLVDAGATADQLKVIDDKYAADSKQIAKDEAQYKKDLRKLEVNDALNASADVLDSVVQLVGEGSAAGKAAAVASATIQTYTSATAAYASVVGVPFVGPVLAPIAAGVAVAAGIMNVKKILSTKTPGGGGGGGAIPTAPAIPRGPVYDPNAALSAASENQSGQNGITLGEQQGSTGATVIKAYVVSSDMSSQQEKDKKISDLARL